MGRCNNIGEDMSYRRFLLTKMIVLILSLSLLFCLIPTVIADKDGINDGEYFYSYGDSINAGTDMGPGCSDNTEGAYGNLLAKYYYPSYYANDVDHKGSNGRGDVSGEDEDTPGKGGIAEWDNGDGFDSDNHYFIFMFGNNDCSRYYNDGWMTCEPIDLARNMCIMRNWTIENDTIPIMCAMIGYQHDPDDGYIHDNPENALPYINETMEYWKNWSIPYVPVWDAVDNNTWDGVLQSNNYSYYNCSSRSHINFLGHQAVAEILHYFIEGWDYNTTYYSSNNTLIVDADYNETIYINNTNYGWDTGNLTVTCLTNSTEISYQVQTAWNGSEMIRFDIQKDSVYELRGDMTITSINNETNGTIMYDEIRLINWTYVTGAEYYRVEISNNTDMSNPWLNLSYINATNYPVNFSMTDDIITFTLPNEHRRYWNRYYNVRVSVYRV